ncbi:hypothetical protein [uncultured Ruminococcus sp.]|uniref:hypothetical protein n=1 Tax=uncultured Ruminococcus sp. TaxID=165186 RepID=UPI0025D3DB5C|nr:hypothetical protein [uncultured Ruminococcus sp.]
MENGISLKRSFLNLGLVLLIIGGLWLINTEVSNNIELTVVHGEVVEVVSDYEVNVAFEVNGEKKMSNAYSMSSGAFKWSYKSVSGLEYLDEGEFFYCARVDKLTTPESSDNASALILFGGILVLCCCKAFKGYKKYFIDRYPAQFFLTVFSEAAVMTLAAYLTYSNNYGGWYGLSDYLGGLFLAFAEQLFVLIMWIVAVSKYKKQCKAAANKENS